MSSVTRKRRTQFIALEPILKSFVVRALALSDALKRALPTNLRIDF